MWICGIKWATPLACIDAVDEQKDYRHKGGDSHVIIALRSLYMVKDETVCYTAANQSYPNKENNHNFKILDFVYKVSYT